LECDAPSHRSQTDKFALFPTRNQRHLFTAMAEANPPVLVAQGIGQLTRSFLRELGGVFWFIMNTFQETLERIQQGRVPFRATSFFRHTQRAGVDSVPLVWLVSFFLGLTMALLTGYQLQRFGTERLIPGLVAIAFTRELGPLMTGIMLAARIGAAFTAELGTMQVNEEVEAIESMGIGPLRFLVAPRMLALVLLMPCLSMVSNIAAVFASSLICKAYFSIAFPYFLDLVKDSLLIRDIITGVLKSFLFGLLIAAIACYRGLTVKGGAAGVGASTTSSVVTAITTVIGFDTLYNVIYTTFYPT
jgi:phospholipid/cholesterol/gamma-HCH transport system permease protein